MESQTSVELNMRNMLGGELSEQILSLYLGNGQTMLVHEHCANDEMPHHVEGTYRSFEKRSACDHQSQASLNVLYYGGGRRPSTTAAWLGCAADPVWRHQNRRRRTTHLGNRRAPTARTCGCLPWVPRKRCLRPRTDSNPPRFQTNPIRCHACAAQTDLPLDALRLLPLRSTCNTTFADINAENYKFLYTPTDIPEVDISILGLPRVLKYSSTTRVLEHYNTIQIKIYIAPNSLIKRDRGAGWSARW